MLLAHERYVLALQPSELVLAAAAELVLGGGGPGAPSAAVELRVPRAWRPAVVVLLTTVDGIALPAGIRLHAVHRGLGVTLTPTPTPTPTPTLTLTLTLTLALILTLTRRRSPRRPPTCPTSRRAAASP